MIKHYVTFFSPGTFVSEQTTKEISSWDVNKAKKMAESITERYNAKPYGFQFFTKRRTQKEWEPKEVKRSNMYYLGGEVLTLEQVKSRNNLNDSILISNMEINRYDRVVQSKTPWLSTHPLLEGDIVLN